MRLEFSGDWIDARVEEFGIAIAGWDAEAHAGKQGVAFVENGLAQAGDHGVAVSPSGDVKAGEWGFAIAIWGRSAEAGNSGFARAAEFGVAVSGAYGVSMCDNGRAEVGDQGLAIAEGWGAAVGGSGAMALMRNVPQGSRRATAQANNNGILIGLWHDGRRDRIAVAYVGENNILPNVPYSLDETGQFVRATDEDGPL